MNRAFHSDGTLTSWGRVARERHLVARPRFGDELARIVERLSAETPGLAIGLRRSYGDTSLNPEGARVVKPGFVDTPMTDGLKKGGAIQYAPGKWRIVMAIIRAVPAFVVHKTKL